MIRMEAELAAFRGLGAHGKSSLLRS